VNVVRRVPLIRSAIRERDTRVIRALVTVRVHRQPRRQAVLEELQVTVLHLVVM